MKPCKETGDHFLLSLFSTFLPMVVCYSHVARRAGTYVHTSLEQSQLALHTIIPPPPLDTYIPYLVAPHHPTSNAHQDDHGIVPMALFVILCATSLARPGSLRFGHTVEVCEWSESPPPSA